MKAAKQKSKVRQNHEKISRFHGTVPPTYEFIASKTDGEKVEYIRRVLARSEEEALAVIKPVFRLIRKGVEVFEVHRPGLIDSEQITAPLP